jgi:hypothetical protein
MVMRGVLPCSHPAGAARGAATVAGLGADPFPLSRRFDLLLYLVGDFVVVARHGFELLA